MGEDSNGDGHGAMLPECVQMFTTIQANQERTNRALWGGEGTTGMVKDLNDMKAQGQALRFLGTTIVGVVASVITTVIILFIGGKL